MFYMATNLILIAKTQSSDFSAEGNGKGMIRFASFRNRLMLRNYFTVDISLTKLTIRTGYPDDFYRTDVNDIVTNVVSHRFMFGLAVESFNFGGLIAKFTKIENSS